MNNYGKYDKQINFTTDLRRMYEIWSYYDFDKGYYNIFVIYSAFDLYIMDAVSDLGNPYNISLSAMLAILDNIGLYLCYLPDILLVSNVLVELATRDQDSTSENLTQGQKNWLNKKFWIIIIL